MFTRVTMVTWLCRLAVMLCVCFLSDASGSAIIFQSSASSIKPLISSNLTLTCSLHDTSSAVVGRSLTSLPDPDTLADDVMTGEEETHTDQQYSDDLDDLDDQTVSKKSVTQTTEDMTYVTSIMISRDGVDLATITEHFPARQVGGASGFQVSGQLPVTSGDKGHLELVWPHPTDAESGNYVCDVSTLSSQGRTFIFSQTLEVSEDDVSIKDLVGHIHQMQLEKEKTDIKTSQIIEEMNAKIGDQANANQVMNQTIGAMLKSEEKMKTENAALNQSLEALRNRVKDEHSVFFSSALSSTGFTTIAVDQTVVYDKIFSNGGAAYSSSTGVFTCPLDGFYHFEVNVFAVNSNSAWLMLRHNGNDVMSSVSHGGPTGYEGGTSNCATIKLAKGDTVNVVGHWRTSTVYHNVDMFLLNTFSGHLISLV